VISFDSSSGDVYGKKGRMKVRARIEGLVIIQ